MGWESHYDVSLVALHARSCQQAGRVRLTEVKDTLSTQEHIRRMLEARAKEKRVKYAPIG